MIELLKAENQSLKKELELLIEQQQKSSEKSKLVKENKTLEEKLRISGINIKHLLMKILKAKKPLKVNKITYNSHEKGR